MNIPFLSASLCDVLDEAVAAKRRFLQAPTLANARTLTESVRKATCLAQALEAKIEKLTNETQPK